MLRSAENQKKVVVVWDDLDYMVISWTNFLLS